MKKASVTLKIFFFGFIISFAALLVTFPSVGREGVIGGILLCGRVVIPSLFPFTMCVLFIMKSEALEHLKFLSPITQKLLGLNFKEFSIFFLSLIGGYPIGARLLSEAADNKQISSKRAERMLLFCVNAGPAFIISAVGGVFASKEIGVVLLISHITASLLLCRFIPKGNSQLLCAINKKSIKLSLADNFVASAAGASSTLISICGFVILFSAINSYMLFFGEKIAAFKKIAVLLEITNSLLLVRNIYLLSFLLGFGGICIWCQIIAASGRLKINKPLFCLTRILHGSISSGLTYIIVKLFRITVPTVSHSLSFKPIYSTPAVTVSLLIMGIVFAASLAGKKYNCKLLEDVV